MDDARLFEVQDGNSKSYVSMKWGVSGNQAASKAQGRPIFDKVLLLEVLAPSQQKSTPVFTVLRVMEDGSEKKHEPYYTQYAPQIREFLAGGDGGELQGTPIDKWTMIDAPFAATLKALKVFTVEQLAEASDTTLQHIGLGAREWQAKAKNWLAAAKDSAIVGKLTAELASRDAEIAALKQQFADLAERVDGRTKEGREIKAAAAAA